MGGPRVNAALAKKITTYHMYQQQQPYEKLELLVRKEENRAETSATDSSAAGQPVIRCMLSPPRSHRSWQKSLNPAGFGQEAGIYVPYRGIASHETRTRIARLPLDP